MITPNTIIALYFISCFYNAYIYSFLVEKYNSLGHRLLILAYVLLGPITTAKLIYWQAEAWWKIKKFRRYLHSPQYAADFLKACNELGVNVEGGNTKENVDKMTKEAVKDLPR